MSLRISITGGNHILHRSLREACERAGHRPTIKDGTSPPDGLYDVAIVLDASLVPGAAGSEGRPGSTAGRGVSRANAPRIVFACAGAEASRTAALRELSSTGTDVIVVRSAPVYGIATDPLTLFLIMMRSLPAVPVLSDTRRVQPIWHEDLANALVAAAALSIGDRRLFDVAGPDAVTHEQLYEQLAALIDRRPLRIPVPEFLAKHGARAAAMLGFSGSIEAALSAASVAERPSDENALAAVFGVTATSLAEGLRRLIVCLDEVTPADGVGSVQVKRFFADIDGSRFGPAELLRMFRERFAEIMPIPIGVEPAAPHTTLEEGAVITMTLTGRGHVEVRVREVAPDQVIVATLRGHAVAGIVRFHVDAHDARVRFEVMTCDSAANPLDWLALSIGGARLQDGNWTRVVQKVVELSGGSSDGVMSEIRTLSATEAAEAERWVRRVIDARDSDLADKSA